MKKTQNSYKKSGVDISLANKLVKHISNVSSKNVKKTNNPLKKEIIGGFGSLYDISHFKMKDPVIFSVILKLNILSNTTKLCFVDHNIIKSINFWLSIKRFYWYRNGTSY